jgi:hypothetical protein
MPTTIPAELEKKIIQRLENNDNRNDIILELCESQGLDWNEAESVVDSIQTEHEVDITLTQSPLLVFLALVIFFGGVGLMAYVAYDVVSMYKTLDEIHPQTPNTGPLGGLLAYLMITGNQYFGLLVLSIAMIVGSLRGMQDVWAAIFAKLGLFQNGL